MSKLFTQRNIADFLVAEGVADAGSVASFIVEAVRALSTDAVVESEAMMDGVYTANLTNANGKIAIAYSVRKLGAGFNEHTVHVKHAGGEYALNRLIFKADGNVAVLTPEAEVFADNTVEVDASADIVTAPDVEPQAAKKSKNPDPVLPVTPTPVTETVDEPEAAKKSTPEPVLPVTPTPVTETVDEPQAAKTVKKTVKKSK